MCYGTGGTADVESARGASRRGGAGDDGDAAAGDGDADVVRRRRPFVSGIPEAALESMAREVTRANAAHLAERTRRIDELVASAVERGDTADRFHWTLVYDLEEAPATTGRAMLLAHRIVPVPPQDLVSDEDLHDELWTVIEALDASGVYLVNTEHMGDRDLYARLYYRILDEPTRCLPPDSEAAEYIDCLHPMDLNPGSMGSRMFERMEKRGASEPVAREGGTRGPICRTGLCDRDRWLPRPGL